MQAVPSSRTQRQETQGEGSFIGGWLPCCALRFRSSGSFLSRSLIGGCLPFGDVIALVAKWEAAPRRRPRLAARCVVVWARLWGGEATDLVKS